MTIAPVLGSIMEKYGTKNVGNTGIEISKFRKIDFPYQQRVFWHLGKNLKSGKYWNYGEKIPV